MDNSTSSSRPNPLTSSGSVPSIFERSQETTHSIANVGSYLFETEEERERRFAEERLNQGKMTAFAQSKAHTPIDGVAKGGAAIANGFLDGVVGVFSEPIQGAKSSGATGFFSGIGKGLFGLIGKPVAGVVDGVMKTTEGFANTPSTLTSLVSGQKDYKTFGSPIIESLNLAKKAKQRHLLLKCFDELEHNGLDKKSVFEQNGPESFIMNLRESFNNQQDVNLEAIEPHIIATILKLFFIELPDPLISYSVYPELLTLGLKSTIPGVVMSQNEEDENIKKIKAYLSQLPEENKAVLSEFCLLLRKFLKSSSRSGIDSHTLTYAIELCLMRPQNYDPNKENGGVLAAMNNFKKTQQISDPEKKAIHYIVRLVILNYQPGYLTFSLFG